MKKKFALVAFAVAVLAGCGTIARGAVYQIDAAHSSVSFKVRHMVIAKTRGHFNVFSGTVHYEPGNPKSWKAEAKIDAASIDTDNKDRDAHLRKPDFFDTKNHPEILFVSKKLKKKGDEAKMWGDLTIRGVTKRVVLDVEINGVVDDPWGNERVGFTATTAINRFDYGITFSKTLDKGGLVVGKKVWITLEVEAARKKG